MQAAAHHISRAFQGGQHLGRADGIALSFHIAALRGGSGHLPGKRRWRHLTAGHAVVGVIDENRGDLLTPGSGCHNLAHADGSQVAVTLIGEDHAVRQSAFDASGHGWRAPVRGFHEIKGEIVIRKHRAAHRRHADGVFQLAHLFQHFRNQAVRYPMRAAGAVMRAALFKAKRALVDQFHV